MDLFEIRDSSIRKVEYFDKIESEIQCKLKYEKVDKSENYMMTYTSGMSDEIKYVSDVRDSLRECHMIVGTVCVRPFQLSAFSHFMLFIHLTFYVVST